MKQLKNLILVDDDEIVVYLTKRLVAKTNLVELTEVFGNGRDVMDYLIENYNNPDLLPEVIFLDLFMPVMDGWEFLEEYALLKPRSSLLLYLPQISIKLKMSKKCPIILSNQLAKNNSLLS